MTLRSPLRLPRNDRGSATVLAVVLVAALAATSMLALGAAVVLVDHRRAQAAADLAALAGAAAAQEGADACVAADSLARANGAVLETCAVTAQTVLVEVVVESRFAELSGEVVGRARAGPAEERSGHRLPRVPGRS